jgi:DNA-binding transcriptional LysR family regulator
MTPTSIEIRYFVEVYQMRHVSKAALRLGVTQPTLTQCLKKLEDKLEAKLFHRTKQGVVPTAEGTLFYGKAKALLDYWQEVQRTVQDSQNETQGRFTIGCHQSVGAYSIPTLLERMHARAPNIEINLVHDFSRKVTEGIVSYNIDLGYVVNPPKHPDLVLKKIGHDRVTFWKKKGAGPLPKRIFADRTQQQIEQLLGKTYRKEFQEWTLVQSTSLELIRTMTHSGQGIGILPERVAKADGIDLVPYDKNLPSQGDEIYLAYRKEVLSSKAGRLLIEMASFAL